MIGVKEPANGIFGIVDDKLFTIPFRENKHYIGVAKSKNTYNHKLWWQNNSNSNKPYNYYPRGRVHFDNKGHATIFMNPNIEEKFIPQIQQEFGIKELPKIRYDHSGHYKCYLDDGWKPDK